MRRETLENILIMKDQEKTLENMVMLKDQQKRKQRSTNRDKAGWSKIHKGISSI